MLLRKASSLACVAIICIAALAGCDRDRFILDIMGDGAVQGADVYVDGTRVGTMDKFGEDGSHFSMKLPHGTHRIEITKPGHAPYHETIVVEPDKGERYVTLEWEKKQREEKLKPSPVP